MSFQDPGTNRIQSRLQRLVKQATASEQDSALEQAESDSMQPVLQETAPPPAAPEPVKNPFAGIQTDKPVIAVRGKRNGYLMIAPSQEQTRYQQLSEDVMAAAWAWAIAMEEIGAPRAYWITLSEAVPHLHIHIYPRWPEDTEQGIPLFEKREQSPQPAWSVPVQVVLQKWAEEYNVELA